jgi:predicted HicB family RNase H-like nuclease
VKPYKGYRAAVRFDDEALVFFGEVTGLRDVITFQAQSAESLVAAFHDSVDDYLEWAETDGFEPEKPFSGSLSLRATPELHRQMTDAAALQAKSLNRWIVEALAAKAASDLDRTVEVG